MIDLTRTHDIAAPASAVWAVLADYRRDPEWRTGVLSMEPDRPGLAQAGTEVHEVLRLGGRTNHIDSVVDAVEVGRRVDWHTTDGATARGHRLVEPLDADRCRVTLGMTITPHGLEKLMAPLFRRMIGRNLERDLATLEGIVGTSGAGAGDEAA